MPYDNRSRVLDSPRVWLGPLIAVALLGILEVFRHVFVLIPNPVGVYVIGVVVCSYFGGMRLGLLGVALTGAYGLYDVAVREWPDEHTRAVWLVTMGLLLPSAALLVGGLRERFNREHAGLFEKSQRLDAATQQLTGEHSRLMDALAAMDAGFALFDAQGRLVICNETYRGWFPGLEAMTVPGMSFGDRLRAVEQGGFVTANAETGRWWVHEAERLRGDPGNARQYALSDGRTLEVTDAGARDGGHVVLLRDLTARRQKEQDLRDRVAHNRAMLDHMINGIVVVDAQGQVQEFNHSAERIFDYEAREVVGQNVKMLMPEPHRSRHDAYLAAYLRTGVGKVMGRKTRVHGQRKDGTAFPMQLGLGEYSIGGKRHFIASFQDLTETERIESQLSQAQKMEALGQLTSGMAHDFNNLLTVVMNNLEMLAEPGSTDVQRTQFVQAAMSAAQRGAELTRRMLVFARRRTVLPERVDVISLAGSVVGLLQRTLGQQVTLELRSTLGIWPVSADPSQLENAIINLAVNARDAMPDGGTITVEIANEHVAEAARNKKAGIRPGDFVAITVRDTGMGMSPDTLRRAFDPFFTTKDPGKGTGLGLSMVYGFAKQSAGHVKMTSEVGKGTAVHLFLPRYSESSVLLGVEKPPRLELRPGAEAPVSRPSPD